MEVKIAVRDKNEKGVITVFLALVFGLLLTFLINLVNVTMVNSAKNQMNKLHPQTVSQKSPDDLLFLSVS